MLPALRHIQPVVFLRRDEQNYDLSPFIQRIVINKSVSRPVDSCIIILNPSVNEKSGLKQMDNRLISFWKKIIRPNNVISVKISDKSENHSFLGLVDSIAEVKSFENRGTSSMIQITLSNLLAKSLMKDEIVHGEFLWGKEGAEELGVSADLFRWFKYGRGYKAQDGEAFNEFVGQPPINAVNYILDKMPLVNAVVHQAKHGKVSEKTTIKKYFTEESKIFNFLAYEILYYPDLTVYAGNLLQYLYACIDMPFYEVFFDVKTVGKEPISTITIRSKPYGNVAIDKDKDLACKHWEDLPMINVEPDEILNLNIGYNDYELKNYFELQLENSIVAPPGSGLSNQLVRFPIVYPDSVKEFGVRPLRARSKMLFDWDVVKELIDKMAKDQYKITEDDRIDMSNLVWKKREKLLEWYAYPYYESGTLTVVGDEDKYQKGNRVKLTKRFENSQVLEWAKKYEITEDKGMEFYIEGLQHVYNYPSLFKTTLTLTKGQPTGLVPDWYADVYGAGKFLGLDRPKLAPVEQFTEAVDSVDKHNDRVELREKITKTEEVPNE